MKPLRIEFEEADGVRFAHIWSYDGVFGHVKELNERIPVGTYLTIPMHLARLVPWLVKKCGFEHIANVLYEHEYLDVLVKR